MVSGLGQVEVSDEGIDGVLVLLSSNQTGATTYEGGDGNTQVSAAEL